MPQCQRTNMILGPPFEMAPGCWRCPGPPVVPGCPGGEVYVDVTTQPWAREPFDLALADAEAEFDRSAPEFRLFMGLHPLTLHPPGRAAEIYLNPSAFLPFREAQMAFQASHESVHLIHGLALSWTHEVVATLFSYMHLERRGFHQYSEINEKSMEERAPSTSTAELLAFNGNSLPEMHARAFVLGRGLVEAVGWPAVRDLSKYPQQSVEEWLGTLPDEGRRKVMQALGANAPDR
jgi:hypothetical protein